MKKFNLLSQNKKIYNIEDVDNPNLLLDMFDYNEIPKIYFDNWDVPINPAEEIYITDTTFRDGQQSRPPYEIYQIVEIYKLLNKLGGPNGIIRQTEFFLYSDKDREAVNKCLDLGYKFPEITGWIRAVKNDFQLVKEMQLIETGILTSVSDYHIFLKLGWTRQKALENYISIVKSAIETGVKPRCHLEDITRADIYGFVVPFVQELMKIAEDTKVPIKIRACDTMGYAVCYPYVSLPRSLPKLFHVLRNECGVPSNLLEWHGHNDFHKVLANATTAWLYGCSSVNGALLGFGERTGNTPIEGAIIEYISLMGEHNGVDISVITDIAEYFKNEIKADIPKNYPFVGDNFNTTSAGIHADGVLKYEQIYNIFNTNKFLKRPVEVTVTDKSGVAGIAYWVNKYLGLKGDERLAKDNPAITNIFAWVMEQYKNRRTTSISADEMKEQIKINLPEYYK